MKRYVAIILLGLGVVSQSALAETALDHASGSSGIKRAVADPAQSYTSPGFDANARFLQIANSCVAGRPGVIPPPPPAATGGTGQGQALPPTPDTSGLFEAQIPTGDLLGGAGGPVGGGAARIPPSTSNGSALGGAAGDATKGMLLFLNSTKGSGGCTSCHAAKPAAKALAQLEGTPVPAMAGVIAKLSPADKANLIAYLKSVK